MGDQETISVYDRQTEEYADLVAQTTATPELLEFIALIKPGGHVLDLGCGPAMDAANMREKGLTVDPVDASAEMVKLANTTYNIGARQGRFEDITAVNAYDGVWANFSLLHARAEDLPNILSSLFTATRADGCLHVGMKLGSGSKRDKLGRLYAYYSESELTGLLETAGFSIGSTHTGSGKGLAGDVEPWIMINCHADKADE